ncbi:hypothetical protein HAX54_044868 [Datura stramonium]|uniref:Transmembrane protein n=1 Tax=Datura stramonium TaxID=4076 RepID=A0ABS8RSM6_DATST|nr:hypothetical protein [Datura stramonium]
MDHIQSRENVEIDLESGGTTSDEDGSNSHDLTGETSTKDLYKAGSGFRVVHLCNGSFVKEISELAIWKRRRTERIKALKKIKKESGSSSKMNILATVITILFFLVIIFQVLAGILNSKILCDSRCSPFYLE